MIWIARAAYLASFLFCLYLVYLAFKVGNIGFIVTAVALAAAFGYGVYYDMKRILATRSK